MALDAEGLKYMIGLPKTEGQVRSLVTRRLGQGDVLRSILVWFSTPRATVYPHTLCCL